MTDQFKYVQAQNFSLSGAGAVAGATSIVLKSFAQINGTLLTMTDFGAIGFGTLEPGNGTLEEQISFTGVTQNANGTATLTGVSTVTMVSPYTASSGLAQTHAGSVTFVISNTAGFYDRLTGKADDETITGTWTFTNPNYPRMDTATPFPTDNEQLATKAYADSLTFAGAPDATTTQKGIVELATQAEVDAKTATGGTGASLVATPALARSTLLSDYVPDTGVADAYVIAPSPTISALVAGQRFSFKVKTTNTTTSTLVVNALSGTAIFKGNGATNLAAGDLVAGQIVEVEYNGTNGFQLMSPSANTINYSAGAYPAANGAAITNINGANITANTIPALTTTNLVYADFDRTIVGGGGTGEETVYTFTIPGGTLGTAGAIQMNILAGSLSRGAGTGTYRFKYGATTVASFTSAASVNTVHLQIHLGATGATNAQSLQLLIVSSGTLTNIDANGTATEDSTANKTFAITQQFDSGNASNIWTKRSIQVEKL